MVPCYISWWLSSIIWLPRDSAVITVTIQFITAYLGPIFISWCLDRHVVVIILKYFCIGWPVVTLWNPECPATSWSVFPFSKTWNNMPLPEMLRPPATQQVNSSHLLWHGPQDCSSAQANVFSFSLGSALLPLLVVPYWEHYSLPSLCFRKMNS